eukprot:SAG31_NODE_7957_length_1555_cov_1.326923_3_plen_112_part_00
MLSWYRCTRRIGCASPVERTQLYPYLSSTYVDSVPCGHAPYRYLSSTKFRIGLNLVRPKFRLEFSMIRISFSSYPIILVGWLQLWLPPGASVPDNPPPWLSHARAQCETAA